MTTSIAGQDAARFQAEIAARTRLAWREYQDALAGKAGPDYEAAEVTAWGVLQAELGLVEDAAGTGSAEPA